MNKSNNSPNPNPTPSVTEAMFRAGLAAYADLSHKSVNQRFAATYLAMKSAAPQHTGLTCCDGSEPPPDPASCQRFAIAILNRTPNGEWIAVQYHPNGDWSVASEPQQPVHADVKRLLREARPYVEQAGLRHHDVSGLLAEIDAVLLVSNSGVERLKGVIYRNCDPFDATAEDAQVIQEIANEMAALDTPTINEGEGQ